MLAVRFGAPGVRMSGPGNSRALDSRRQWSSKEVLVRGWNCNLEDKDRVGGGPYYERLRNVQPLGAGSAESGTGADRSCSLVLLRREILVIAQVDDVLEHGRAWR
jgi:hypothetical protein